MSRVLEDALAASWALRRKPLESFLLPQAALEDGLLACADGSLVSLFRIEGARSMSGAEELERFVEVACRRLNSRLAEPGHALHLVLERAPDEAGTQVDRFCARAGRQAARLGLGLRDVLDERARWLAPLLAAETAVLACWTRPAALTVAEARRGRKRLRARLKHWLPAPGEAQCPLAVLDGLEARHRALVDTLGALFRETGIVAGRLGSEAALRSVRALVNGSDTTEPDWRPVTVASHAHARATEPPEAGAFPPPLAPQILVRDPERVRAGIRIGRRLYGALDMTLGPRQSRPFAELMEGLAEARLPCRFSILIEGGGLRRLGAAAARVSSAFLAFSHPDSRAVRDAMRCLAGQDADSQAVVRLRLGMLTWVDQGVPLDQGAPLAPEDGEDELARRLGRLQQVAEGWGECVFSPLVGDPLEAFAASVPGFCCGGTAEPALAPLSEALRLLPVCRPAPLAHLGASPGSGGPPRSGGAPPSAADHIFRAPDGRTMPFSCAGGEDHGFDLIHGIPGRGKSVLMNSLTLAHVLQSGQARLPLAATIDIGSSSSGLISLIKEALPPERRAEAGWFPLRMSAACAINPCDTQLGCRSPLPAERAFLENLLGLILTPAGAAGGPGCSPVPDGMRELIGPTIARTYALRSDLIAGTEPNVYGPGRDGEVDHALERAGIAPSELSWWEVVDALFDAGDAVAASRAQRYAVPVLGDFLAAVREPAVQGLIGDARHGAGGETVTQAFIRIMTALSGSWPAMFAPTAFDTGAARVAAIDLREVAPRGSAEADRQTAAFYMLARHALTRHWWIAEEDIDQMPERYRAWHRARLREIRETPKRLAFDEFHRTGAAPAVRAQVERDAREARKHGVRLCLASQRHDDFGAALVELANRIWVLGAGGKAGELESLSGVFELGATVADAVSHRLTGPGPEGAPALLVATDAGGRFEQVVVNAPGPVELWALTTAPRDAALRERLHERLAPAEARAALARRFPSGTAHAWIEAELRRLELRGARIAASESDLLDGLADELARSAREFAPGDALSAAIAADEPRRPNP